MSEFIKYLKEKVLLCDGGTGTLFQRMTLDLKKDFLNLENCFEILTVTRPDVVKEIHRAYLEAGVDCIETNTFGANGVVLSEFGITDRVYELNFQAARLAREIANQYVKKNSPRFVLGAIGPGTKLPSLGHITYDELVASYFEQAQGLLAGGVDGFLLETNQDLLTIKAEIQACKLAKKKQHKMDVPIFVQVTMESNGLMLVGSDMATVVATLLAMDVEGVGLNCGTGPEEMSAHIQYLAHTWPAFISVMPNAGLPIVVDGQTTYTLQPDSLAKWGRYFVEECGVNLIGGCCGTTPNHIAALRLMLDNRKKKSPVKRHSYYEPSVSSLFAAIPFRQENAVFAIGERANANGSKQFRELLQKENWEGMLAIEKEQVKEGSHAVDVCAAYAGRNEKEDMIKLLTLSRTQLIAPLSIDSTNQQVIEASLKLLGGKSLINSINLEEGEEKAIDILKLAKQFGTAVIALTIDAQGMAKTVGKKVTIAKRLYEIAIHQCGLPPYDLLIDPLTFTVCTGVEEDRRSAVNTLDAIQQISALFPACQIVLGISNISYGLKPEARHVLNSVFLHYAQQRGVTAAIIHISKIMPLYKIPEIQRQAAENLLFNRWQNDKDPLLFFIDLFSDLKVGKVKKEKLSVEEELRQHIIEGNKEGLEVVLKKALEKYEPLDIVNDHLLEAMKIVGDLFGSGEMQLPFVLQSAETMKAAVTYLQPYIAHHNHQKKGILVLATVTGDVHDIGKNLVDIILSNNGYEVINLGIKQSIQDIIDAAKKHHADAIGMSGLLVKSTLIMKENLLEMRRQNLTVPVILGGAALTQNFVETECTQAYEEGSVYYAKDAFSGLKLMQTIMEL